MSLFIRTQHIKTHAVLTVWEDNPNYWYKTITFTDEGKQVGFFPSRLEKLPAGVSIHDPRATVFEQQMHEALKTRTYQIITTVYPRLQQEGRVLAHEGVIVIPHGKDDWKEGWMEIK